MSTRPDLESIRRTYAEERSRRMRADGLRQFEYTDAREDPAAGAIEREPLHDEVDAIVIGAGIGGLTTAVRLRQAGLERVRVVDRAADFGGTWYWNRYPGAQCDIESYIYVPFLEETGYVPSLKYAYQPEILGHLHDLARKYGLYDLACFQTEVEGLTWDEEDRRWTVRTDRGDALRGRFVVIAGGFLQRPKLPGVPGLGEFEGKVFHTSRWDYSYTGGEPGRTGGGLPGLADKKVGIVGTGATALQCVPPVAAAAESLHVFQRTPTVVFERNNRPTDPEWAATLQPGWQKARMDAFINLTSGVPVDDPIDDGWTHHYAPMALAMGAAAYGGPAEREAAEIFDAGKIAIVHDRVRSIVENPDDAASLSPRYRLLCKRPSFHDEYLATFNRPTVTLVDTHGRGVEKITPRGAVVDGVEYELDCLIFATGFDTRDMITSIGIDPVGRGGRRLSEHWSDSIRTHHGLFTHGFPNCFLVGLTQTAAAVNFAHSLVEQADHVGHIMGRLLERDVEVVETTVEAEDAWVAAVAGARTDYAKEFGRSCTPGYYNNEGAIEERGFGAGTFQGGPLAFFGILRSWREAGTMEGLTFR